MPPESTSWEPRRKLPSLPWGSILLFFLFGGLIAAAFYHRCPRWRDTIVFVGSVLGGTAGLYSLLLAVEQYEASVAQHRAGVEQSQRQMAHHLIERWNNPAMETQKNVLREVLHLRAGAAPINPVIYAVTKNKNSGKLEAPADEHKQQRSDVVAILSFCEEVALAVNVGSANEDLVRRYFEQVLADIFDGFYTWIDAERGAQGDNELYAELQTVVRKWKTPRS
jgi:hypothetical protein